MNHRLIARRFGVVVTSAMALPMASATLAMADVPEPTVPPDVAGEFSGRAVLLAQESAQDFSAQAAEDSARGRVLRETGPQAPDLSGDVVAGVPHQVFVFTAEFPAGTSTTTPVEATEEWVALLSRGSTVLGTIRVWKPDGGPAESAGYTGDTVLGTSLLDLAAEDVFVEDATLAVAYVLRDGVLYPLAAEPQAEFASATESAGMEAPTWWIVAGLSLAFIGVGGAARVARSQRRRLSLS